MKGTPTRPWTAIGAPLIVGLVLLMPSRARADGPDSQPDDAWGAVRSRGLRQEGIKTDNELSQEERKRTEETDAAVAQVAAVREPVRLVLAASLGAVTVSRKTISDARSFARGTGTELQVGAGIRKGFGSTFEILVRGLFTYASAARSSSSDSGSSGSSGLQTSSNNNSPTIVGASVDATARVHFGGRRKAVYAGAGVRLDAVSYAATNTKTTTFQSTTLRRVDYDDKTLVIDPNGVVEVGYVIGRSEFLDIGFRLAAGPNAVHVNVVNVGVAF